MVETSKTFLVIFIYFYPYPGPPTNLKSAKAWLSAGFFVCGFSGGSFKPPPQIGSESNVQVPQEAAILRRAPESASNLGVEGSP